MAPPVKNPPPSPTEVSKARQIDVDRLKKKTTATLRLGSFQSKVMARAESWLMAAKNIGSAYAIAAKKHQETVDAQKADDALDTMILFSVLSSFAIGGLSWLSSFAQNKFNAREIMLKPKTNNLTRRNLGGPTARAGTKESPYSKIIEALEDGVQAGTGAGLTNVVPMVLAPKLDAVSEHPQHYQNELENKVGKVKMMAFTAFSEIQKRWADAPLEYWDGYNEKEQAQEHDAWQKSAEGVIGDDALRDVGWMAVEFERGMWKKYILEKHTHLDFGVYETDESFDYVGDIIIDRLQELGITQEAGISAEVVKSQKGWRDHDRVVGPLANWAARTPAKPLIKY